MKIKVLVGLVGLAVISAGLCSSAAAGSRYEKTCSQFGLSGKIKAHNISCRKAEHLIHRFFVKAQYQGSPVTVDGFACKGRSIHGKTEVNCNKDGGKKLAHYRGVFSRIAANRGSSAKSGPTVVACANNSLTNVGFKSKPKHCIFRKRGSGAGIESAYTKSLKWKHWGRPHARGRGTSFLNMLGATPVKVVLSKPVTQCGHRTYSKVKIRYPKQDLGGDYPLDTCK